MSNKYLEKIAMTTVRSALGDTSEASLGMTVKQKEDLKKSGEIEKLAFAKLLGSASRRIATGAAIGGVSGALAAGDDNRLKGALGGAIAGGALGALAGKRGAAKVDVRSAPAQLGTNITNVGPSNVMGFGTSRGKSPLAKNMNGFSDV